MFERRVLTRLLAAAYRGVIPKLAAWPPLFTATAPALRYLAPRIGSGSRVPDPLSFAGFTLYHGGRPSYTARALWEGVYEQETLEELSRLLRPGDMFVDVGAHIGLFTLLAARLAGAGGRVLALEPDPQNYRHLQRNVETNLPRSTPVTLVESAAGAASEARAIWRDPRDTGAFSLAPRPGMMQEEGAVSVITLDAWAAHHGWPHVRMLKLDCEGSEPAALAGTREWCSRGPIDTAIVEVNATTLRAASSTVEQLLGCLRVAGFSSIRDLRTGNALVSRSQVRKLSRETSLIPVNVIAER